MNQKLFFCGLKGRIGHNLYRGALSVLVNLTKLILRSRILKNSGVKFDGDHFFSVSQQRHLNVLSINLVQRKSQYIVKYCI